MRNRKAFFAVQGSIILGFIILNVLIFYMVNCNGEYLQSRDVWGNTQTILKSDLKSRQKLINEFSQNTASPTGSHDGGRNRIFRKATVPQPGRAAPLHRPQAVRKLHLVVFLLQSPVWSRSSTKEDRWSAPQSTALPILQRATRTFF